MATNVLTPYKLTPSQKKQFIAYLSGKQGIQETAKKLGMTRTRIYVMVTVIMRHAASTGSLDAKDLIAKY